MANNELVIIETEPVLDISPTAARYSTMYGDHPAFYQDMMDRGLIR